MSALAVMLDGPAERREKRVDITMSSYHRERYLTAVGQRREMILATFSSIAFRLRRSSAVCLSPNTRRAWRWPNDPQSFLPTLRAASSTTALDRTRGVADDAVEGAAGVVVVGLLGQTIRIAAGGSTR
jgi:hypothetical protein